MTERKMTEEQIRKIIEEVLSNHLSVLTKAVNALVFSIDGDHERGVEGLADKIKKVSILADDIKAKETITKTDTMYEHYLYARKAGEWKTLSTLNSYMNAFKILIGVVTFFVTYNIYELLEKFLGNIIRK